MTYKKAFEEGMYLMYLASKPSVNIREIDKKDLVPWDHKITNSDYTKIMNDLKKKYNHLKIGSFGFVFNFINQGPSLQED